MVGWENIDREKIEKGEWNNGRMVTEKTMERMKGKKTEVG